MFLFSPGRVFLPPSTVYDKGDGVKPFTLERHNPFIVFSYNVARSFFTTLFSCFRTVTLLRLRKPTLSRPSNYCTGVWTVEDLVSELDR